jgi:phenylalanyl-tRNA synthetase beta chain
MKVSLNWIKEFIDFELPPIDELVEKIGAQLGAVDEVVDLGKKYQGIIIAKVVSCEKHPDADKLSLCMIDDGGVVQNVERNADGHVQVVCGAPNVKADLMVAWLPPGVIVPETVDKEPFILEAREIRGQKSNGMLASPKELALGDHHEGILELDVINNAKRIKQGEVSHVEAIHNYLDDPSIKPGDDFAKTYKLDDYIIELENKMFTHRPDCFGILGIAREIAGILGHQFGSPTFYKASKTPGDSGETAGLKVHNEVPELVPRFVMQCFDNVRIGPSPVWLQTCLSRVGVRSINNVVDITNYFMLLTGQPLHAYDYDKVKALSSGDRAVIIVRNPKPGEKIRLLNGKEVEPRPEAVMIATDQQLIGIGGVMGGAETEISDQTQNIILECASFDMYSIRRTSMAHGLFTDAVTRFNKGQSPLQNDRIIDWVKDQLICDAGAMPGEVIDLNHLQSDIRERDSLHPPVQLTAGFINDRLGLDLSIEVMKTLLENVEFKVEINNDELKVIAPFWRTDIELREDVVEEVGRLYGYDKLPLELPRRDLTPTAKDPLLNLKATIRTRLSEAGANEVLTYSFVHGDLLAKTGQDQAKAFQVANALSPDLQYYRISLMPSLLDKVHPNIKAGYDQFALFELGKTHDLDHLNDEGVPTEFEFTALLVTANNKVKPAGAPYYQARQFLETLTQGRTLEFKPVTESMQQYPVVQPYDLNRTAMVSFKDGNFLGIIGEFKSSVTRALKLPQYAAGFEIDTTALQTVLTGGPSYAPLSRFPSVKQDITLKVASELSYDTLHSFLNQALDANTPETTQVQLGSVDIYQKSDDAGHKQLTFRVTVTDTERTLTDTEVTKFLDTVAEAAKTELNAERI